MESSSLDLIYGDALTQSLLIMQSKDDESISEEQKLQNAELLTEFKDLSKQLVVIAKASFGKPNSEQELDQN